MAYFSALMSLGLLLDGILGIQGKQGTACYQYKIIYGLFIIPIITSFYSVLGMSIERFQAFALYRDRRKFTRKFSIAWFMASWTLAVCFLVILLAQIVENNGGVPEDQRGGSKDRDVITVPDLHQPSNYHISLSDMDLFPGPHSYNGVTASNVAKEDITTTATTTVMMTSTTESVSSIIITTTTQ